MFNSYFYQELKKGFIGSFFKIPAKGIFAHECYICNIFKRNGILEMIHRVLKHIVHPFSFILGIFLLVYERRKGLAFRVNQFI